jgi:UDPglucose 6-dehydrogenase
MVHKIVKAAGGVEGKTVAVLGLSYKPNTDDVRDSPAIDIIRKLQDHGAQIRACDPQAIENAGRELKEVEFFEDPYEAAQGCHALVVATEWNEFRRLDLARMRAALTEPVMVDLRNVYDPAETREQGFRYVGVGR